MGVLSIAFGNCSLDRVSLLAGLKSLILGDGFNTSIVKTLLPKDLRRLSFGENFDQYMDNTVLPNCLQEFCIW